MAGATFTHSPLGVFHVLGQFLELFLCIFLAMELLLAFLFFSRFGGILVLFHPLAGIASFDEFGCVALSHGLDILHGVVICLQGSE